MRCVWVKVPAFSTWVAAGMRKTSVPISSVFNSPERISGESYQKEAVSISWKSRTTSHFKLAKARRCIPPLDWATAGFWPKTKYPSTTPLSMACNVSYVECAPDTRGR